MITDAQLALLALYAEDMYRPLGIQAPAWDARLLRDWSMRGYLIANDAVLSPLGGRLATGAQRVFYGVLVESKTLAGTFAVVVRGTEGLLEWIEDAEFLQRPHPEGGKVEDGFWSIYQTMAYRDVGTTTDAPLIGSLQKRIGNGRAYVVGHSLGAAIATYLALDVSQALLAGRTALRAFASPHPGDAVFATVFTAYVKDYESYAYALDVVPKVPPLDGYTALPGRTMLPASPLIRDHVFCNHHALSYATLLDDSAPRAAAGSAPDRPYLDCIQCLTSGAATTAAS